MKKVILFVSLFLFMINLLQAEIKEPMAVLVQVKGNVEYAKNGKKWKKILRDKFLFIGYQVRTGPNGSGKIINQKTGENMLLEPNSLIAVSKTGELQIKTGTLTKSQNTSKLLSGLMKGFSKSQTFTTVRRSSQKENDEAQLDAARHIILTDDYPFLVWENIGEEYAYNLRIGDKSYKVTPSKDDLIRVKIEPFSQTEEFSITAHSKEEEKVQLKTYKKNNHTIHWMTALEKDKFRTYIKTIQENYPDNAFMKGNFFEKEEMWVAAMDKYKEYLKNNPDEIEMTPYLFMVYKKLKLKRVYTKELESYKKAMKE
ncbi:hypothetical protein KKA14_11420 [bacterium]|nr:hypothetical protein [bacterium]